MDGVEVVTHERGPYRGPMAASSKRDKLPIKMLNDRILVDLHIEGERRSGGDDGSSEATRAARAASTPVPVLADAERSRISAC